MVKIFDKNSNQLLDDIPPGTIIKLGGSEFIIASGRPLSYFFKGESYNGKIYVFDISDLSIGWLQAGTYHEGMDFEVIGRIEQ